MGRNVNTLYFWLRTMLAANLLYSLSFQNLASEPPEEYLICMHLSTHLVVVREQSEICPLTLSAMSIAKGNKSPNSDERERTGEWLLACTHLESRLVYPLNSARPTSLFLLIIVQETRNQDRARPLRAASPLPRAHHNNTRSSAVPFSSSQMMTRLRLPWWCWWAWVTRQRASRIRYS